MHRPGYDRLWMWFSLSRASWLTLPRVMMHEMPDEWQDKMAELLEEWDRTYTNQPDVRTSVFLKKDQKFIKSPSWLQYRHPDKDTIESFKGNHQERKV